LNRFPDDGYDYHQHLKEVGAANAFYLAEEDPNMVHKLKFGLNDSVFASLEEEDIPSIHREIFEEKMDPDLKAALNANSDEEYEELDDNFVATANQDKLKPQDFALNKEGSNYEKGEEDTLKKEEEDFEQFLAQYDAAENQKHQSSAVFDQYTNQKDYSRPTSNRELTFLEQKFKVELEKYNAAIEEGESDEPSNKNGMDISQFEGLLDEFFDSRKPKPFPENFNYEVKLSQQKKPDINKDNSTQTSNDQLHIKNDKDEEQELKMDEEELNKNEEEIGEELDHQFIYLDDLKRKAQWDCESILSTYSSTENHPTLLQEEGEPHKIKLSKFGIPIEILKARQKEVNKETITTVDQGEARPKNETPEMRRGRKKMLKEKRRQNRQTKKQLKDEYKRENIRYNQSKVLSKPIPTVVHY